MKNWTIICLTLYGLQGSAQIYPVANEAMRDIMAHSTKQAAQDSFLKTLPEAISDALLLDLPLDLLLYGLGVGPIPSQFATRTVATIGGYSVRKTCKDYHTNNGTLLWQQAALCGFAGGALKYSTRSAASGTFDALEPLVGAIDAGLYEGTSHLRGSYPTLEYMAIEATVAVIQNIQAIWLAVHQWDELGKHLRAGAAVGALVGGFVHTTISWYGSQLSQMLNSVINPDTNTEVQKPT